MTARRKTIKLRRSIFSFFSLLAIIISFFAQIFISVNSAAAQATFSGTLSWESSSAIRLTYKGSTLTMSKAPSVPGQAQEVFFGSKRVGDCQFVARYTVTFSGIGTSAAYTGVLSFPAKGPVVEDPDNPSAPYCESPSSYSGVSVSGNRPGNGTTPETAEQKKVQVLIRSNKPADQTPGSMGMRVTGPNGYNQTFTLSVANGREYNWNTSLEPGTYNYIYTSGLYNGAGGSFTKKRYEKYVAQWGEYYGSRNIEVTVELTGVVGEGFDIVPSLPIILRNPDGTEVKRSNTEEVDLSGIDRPDCGFSCGSAQNTYRTVGNLTDVGPGSYKICVPVATSEVCKDFTKVSGQPGNVTITLQGIDSTILLENAADTAGPEDRCDQGKTKDILGFDTGIPDNPMQWFVCGAAKMLGNAIDALSNIVANLLNFNPTSQNNGDLERVWGNMLRLANILFVIAFLVMIISTALDLGIFSNYTVKKLLPRIIIAALLANLSWGISTVLVDITNAVGGATREIILAPLNLQDGQLDTGRFLGDAAINADGAGLLQGGVIVGLGTLIYLSLASAGAILLPIIAVAFIAIVIAIGALLLRRIIIILLIIFAPLAFAMWALPNGEKVFQRWWKIFTQMLLMYPMIMALFTSGIFISQLLVTDGEVANGLGALTSVTAFIAIILPYLLIPTLFKLAGGVLGNITGMVNDRSKGLIDRSRKWRDEGSQWGRRKQLKAQRKNFTGHEKLIESMNADKLAGSEWLQRRRRAQGLGRNWAQGEHALRGQRMFLAKTKASASKERLDAAMYDLEAGGIDTRGMEFNVTDTEGKITGQKGRVMRLKKDDALAMAALGATIERDDGYVVSDGSEDAQRAAAQYAASQGLVPVIKQIRDGGTVTETNGNSIGIQNAVRRRDAQGNWQYQNQHANAILSEAMQSKVGAMMPKMPSYFKGPGLAFQGIEAGSMAGFHEEEVGSMFEYLNDNHSKANNASLTQAQRDEAQQTLDLTWARMGQSLKQIVADPAKYNMSPTALARLKKEAERYSASGKPIPSTFDSDMMAALRRVDGDRGVIM